MDLTCSTSAGGFAISQSHINFQASKAGTHVISGILETCRNNPKQIAPLLNAISNLNWKDDQNDFWWNKLWVTERLRLMHSNVFDSAISLPALLSKEMRTRQNTVMTIEQKAHDRPQKIRLNREARQDIMKTQVITARQNPGAKPIGLQQLSFGLIPGDFSINNRRKKKSTKLES